MEKTTDTIRRVDELGRVVLPAELRKRFDIQPEDALEIIEQASGDGILLKKVRPCCLRCRSTQHLTRAAEQIWFCQDCLTQMLRHTN